MEFFCHCACGLSIDEKIVSYLTINFILHKQVINTPISETFFNIVVYISTLITFQILYGFNLIFRMDWFYCFFSMFFLILFDF